MKMKLHYLMDDVGRKTAVQISIQDWLAFQRERVKQEQLTSMENQLRKAFSNLEDIHKGKKKARTISDIVNEL
jgi:hypothetical protein